MYYEIGGDALIRWPLIHKIEHFPFKSLIMHYMVFFVSCVVVKTIANSHRKKKTVASLRSVIMMK